MLTKCKQYYCLYVNEDKTEIILKGTQPQLNKINISHLSIGQTSVPVGNSAVRNLGSWFDSNLNMITHINKACQSSFYNLSNIRQICKYLSPSSTKLLIQAGIMARIDYCNSLLYLLFICQSYKDFKMLQRD